MKTALLIIATIGFLTTSYSHERGNVQSTLKWHTDAEAAFAEAKQEGKPVLAVFR